MSTDGVATLDARSRAVGRYADHLAALPEPARAMWIEAAYQVYLETYAAARLPDDSREGED